jgi:glycine cleavage system regulatory protein
MDIIRMTFETMLNQALWEVHQSPAVGFSEKRNLAAVPDCRTAGRAHSLACMNEVLLTLIGPDKTGIVANLARIASEHEGNWLDSRMMRLGGSFSGILRIALPGEKVDGFSQEASGFLKDNGFQCSIQPAAGGDAPVEGTLAKLQLSGQDHPGIVYRIFEAFRKVGVNVEELSTGVQAAPWSGTPIFEAKARLRLPESVSPESLQDDLEELASDLMVEITQNFGKKG